MKQNTSNKYRTNDYVFSVWENSFIATKAHFYHVGGKETNRNAVYEALISNFKLENSILTKTMKTKIENKESQLTTEKNTFQLKNEILFR
ncbi:MAG: hypothetical protein ACPG5B_01025 [Chitinophagales bacterium]